MDLKKIMALAMMALMVIPSLTMAVRADPDEGVGLAEGEDLASAIERAQTYLENVRDSAEALALEYPEGHMIHGYLNEIDDLLGQEWEEDHVILYQTDAFGTAEMRNNESRGNYVFLSDGGVGLLNDEYVRRENFGMGRVVITGVDTLLTDIAPLSYDFYYTFPDSIIHPDFQAFPYMVLECDAEGGDVADLWIVLISTQIEHDEHSGESMPALETWLTWTLAGYDNWHDAGPGATGNVGEPTEGAPLAAMRTAYPDAKVLNVKVAVGEWANGDYDAITGCVDDIEIDGVTYDFEEEHEYLGAEGFLAQASACLVDEDFNSAARNLAAARNILGRVKGLLNRMAKAHKVTRIERFMEQVEHRIKGIVDKVEKLRGRLGEGKANKAKTSMGLALGNMPQLGDNPTDEEANEVIGNLEITIDSINATLKELDGYTSNINILEAMDRLEAKIRVFKATSQRLSRKGCDTTTVNEDLKEADELLNDIVVLLEGGDTENAEDLLQEAGDIVSEASRNIRRISKEHQNKGSKGKGKG